MKNIERWFWVDRERLTGAFTRRRGLWAVNRKGKKFIKGRCLHEEDGGQNVLELTGGDSDFVPYVVQYKTSIRGAFGVEAHEEDPVFSKLYLYGEPDFGCVNVCFLDKRFYGKRVNRKVFYIK